MIAKKKNQKLTRFLSGCSFFYTFCQFLQDDSYLRAENFMNTCQRARFREHHRVVLARKPGLVKVKQEMGMKVLPSHRIFISYNPQ